MTTQSEAILENNLVKQLTGLGDQRVSLLNETQLLQNLKEQLELFRVASILQAVQLNFL